MTTTTTTTAATAARATTTSASLCFSHNKRGNTSILLLHHKHKTAFSVHRRYTIITNTDRLSQFFRFNKITSRLFREPHRLILKEGKKVFGTAQLNPIGTHNLIANNILILTCPHIRDSDCNTRVCHVSVVMNDFYPVRRRTAV
jgi:hypothetical protein